MHLEICGAARGARRRALLGLYAPTALAAVASASAAAGAFVAGVPPAAAAVGVVGGAATAGLHYFNAKEASQKISDLDTVEGLDGLYRSVYASEHVRGDGDAAAVWSRVRAHLLAKVAAVGGAALAPPPPRGAARKLRRVLESDVPRLRREAAPATYPDVRHPEEN